MSIHKLAIPIKNKNKKCEKDLKFGLAGKQHEIDFRFVSFFFFFWYLNLKKISLN